MTGLGPSIKGMYNGGRIALWAEVLDRSLEEGIANELHKF